MFLTVGANNDGDDDDLTLCSTCVSMSCFRAQSMSQLMRYLQQCSILSSHLKFETGVRDKQEMKLMATIKRQCFVSTLKPFSGVDVEAILTVLRNLEDDIHLHFSKEKTFAFS